MAVIQRFGGALNLNVHLHVLVIDGVFAPRGGGVVFWPAPALAALDVAEVLAGVVARVDRLLARRGMGDADEAAGAADGWAEQAPVLAGIAAASGWRWGLGPVGACADTATRLRAPTRLRSGGATRVRRASICTRTPACRRARGIGSSG